MTLKMNFERNLFFVVLFAIFLCSCASAPEKAGEPKRPEVIESGIQPYLASEIETQYGPEVRGKAGAFNRRIALLASQLTGNLKEYDPEARSLVVTSFVDLDNLAKTSRFGRFVTERLAYEMHRAGYRVFEIRQARKIEIVKNEGEFHLTRESRELLDKYRSDAVIVGTYALVSGELTLHARMVERDTSRVVSVAALSFNLEEDPYTASLFRSDKKPGVILAITPLQEDE